MIVLSLLTVQFCFSANFAVCPDEKTICLEESWLCGVSWTHSKLPISYSEYLDLAIVSHHFATNILFFLLVHHFFFSELGLAGN
jgi:hypothetical protein